MTTGRAPTTDAATLGGFGAWRRSPPWVAYLLLGAGLALCWAAVYGTGGTGSALPHLFYVVILGGASRFGRRGGVVTALLATVVCGPLMPLDTVAGIAQPWLNWLSRGVFFLLIGGLTGAVLHALSRNYQDQLSLHLQREMERVGPAGSEQLATSLRPRIEAVIAAEGFRLVFQPIYSFADGRLVAVEALTRFDAEPIRPPNVWFEEAARAGLGVELELAVIGAAFQASEDLRDGVALSVNCSPATLADPRLVEFVHRQQRRPLIVEITEHAVVDDYKVLDDAILALRRWGATLAIDDAGAGFASLRHIVRLAPEIIKLDISLTQNLRRDPARRALADCLIRFARQTGSQLVAEGIEHASDLATWAELGADAAQGFHLGRPGALPAPPFCRPLRAHVDRVIALPEAASTSDPSAGSAPLWT
jgi:EAL domain-containing protein (putative c-di-GMP-specific phosphodiesterase class I)